MEQFRLVPPDHIYYVYALVDPRIDKIFYIGKGKDGRYKDHYKNYNKEDNFEKFNRIKELKEKRIKLKVVKLIDFLDEETAFKIEEIIIYNLGRKAFNEGPLLNIKRGGNSSRDSSYFYNKKLDTKPLKKNIPFLNKEYLYCSIKTSRIVFLSELPFNYIYEYNFEFNFINKISKVDFFKNIITSHSFQLFNQNHIAVMFKDRIFSVKKELSFYNFKHYYPIAYFLPYDKKFLKELETKLKGKINFEYQFTKDLRIKIKEDKFINICIFKDDEKVYNELFGDFSFQKEYMLKRPREIEISNKLPKKGDKEYEMLSEKDKESIEWERIKHFL